MVWGFELLVLVEAPNHQSKPSTGKLRGVPKEASAMKEWMSCVSKFCFDVGEIHFRHPFRDPNDTIPQRKDQ